MNLEQIIEEINKDLDDTLDHADIIGWVNRCVDDLSIITKKEDKKLADISSLNAYELPEDLLEMVLVLVNNEEYDPIYLGDTTSKGYKVWGNVLSLIDGPDSGAIELYYYKRLPYLVNVEDVPEIDKAFHDLFVLYTVAHNQFMEEETERQMDALNRYMSRKREFDAFMKKNTARFNSTRKIKNVYSAWWN
jgi:hypothetical protein